MRRSFEMILGVNCVNSSIISFNLTKSLDNREMKVYDHGGEGDEDDYNGNDADSDDGDDDDGDDNDDDEDTRTCSNQKPCLPLRYEPLNVFGIRFFFAFTSAAELVLPDVEWCLHYGDGDEDRWQFEIFSYLSIFLAFSFPDSAKPKPDDGHSSDTNAATPHCPMSLWISFGISASISIFGAHTTY